jgi:hypothetical protein
MDDKELESKLTTLKGAILKACESFREETGYRVIDIESECFTRLLSEDFARMNDVKITAVKGSFKVVR